MVSYLTKHILHSAHCLVDMPCFNDTRSYLGNYDDDINNAMRVHNSDKTTLSLHLTVVCLGGKPPAYGGYTMDELNCQQFILRSSALHTIMLRSPGL